MKDRKRNTESGQRQKDFLFDLLSSMRCRLSSIAHRPSSFLRDRWGSVAVQAFLLIPIFVLVALGGYEILKVMSVKHALHEGTYQAVRYLALNPVANSKRPEDWEAVAETLIFAELEATIRDSRAGQVQVQVIPPSRRPCTGDSPYTTDSFTLRVTLRWSFEVPFARDLPPAVNLREEYRNVDVICE